MYPWPLFIILSSSVVITLGHSAEETSTFPSNVEVAAWKNAPEGQKAEEEVSQPPVEESSVKTKDLEHKQDTVARQVSSSGKLQHILRAHFVGTAENEQKFEAQDASEQVPARQATLISLNDAYFRPMQNAIRPPLTHPAAFAAYPFFNGNPLYQAQLSPFRYLYGLRQH